MSNTMSFKWQGLEELRRELRELAADVSESSGAVNRIVLETMNAAAAALEQEYGQHRVTGNLASSVRKKNPRPGVGIVYSSAPHAHLFEDGTKARQTKRGFNRGREKKHRSIARVAVQQRAQMVARLVDLLRSHGFEVHL
jgi:hypothetical protein